MHIDRQHANVILLLLVCLLIFNSDASQPYLHNKFETKNSNENNKNKSKNKNDNINNIQIDNNIK